MKIYCIYIWGVWCQKQVSKAGISNYIPQISLILAYVTILLISTLPFWHWTRTPVTNCVYLCLPCLVNYTSPCFTMHLLSGAFQILPITTLFDPAHTFSNNDNCPPQTQVHVFKNIDDWTKFVTFWRWFQMHFPDRLLYWIKCEWNLFIEVLLTIIQHYSRYWFGSL